MTPEGHLGTARVTFSRLVLFASMLLVGCSGRHDTAPAATGPAPSEPKATPTGGTLSVKGSDTMVILAQKWAEAYRSGHQGATIQVSGGGSGTGIAALLNGTTDIADASRPMKDSERESLRTSRHAEAVETKVALDALAVYVHEGNSLDHLTLDQLKGIYRGQITNWKDVGGPNLPIVLYSRENSSGTYAYFKEHVLKNEDFAATAQTLPGTAAVIQAVSHDPNGVGYGGIAYATGVRLVKVAGADGTPIEPTMQNATSGVYPLSRFLFMYTAGAPAGLAKDFIDFVLSPAGQQLVESVGYFPLPHEAAPSPGATTGTPAPPG